MREANGAQLAAGGTLPRSAPVAAPGVARRARLVAEIAALFVLAPIGLVLATYGLRIPLFVSLPPLLLCFAAVLALDRSFRLRRELTVGVTPDDLVSIAVVFAVAALVVSAFVQKFLPAVFLSMPTQRPRTWLTVITLYPLLSVAAQELVYRTFFFHRYGPLFGANRWLAVVTNGLLFGFAHIVFYNWVAILGTAASGTLFAWRYTETRSFWAVWLEHSLYGILIFTVGLGGYFFTGIANSWRW